MRTLPKGYMERVWKEDRLLRIRWSMVEECWMFERVFTRPCSLDRVRSYVLEMRKAGIKQITPEQVNNMVDGTFNLDRWQPCMGDEWVNTGVACDGLPKLDRLIEMLQYGDTQRIAGTGDVLKDAREIASTLDTRDELRENVKHARRIMHYEDIASEAWDHLAWQEKRRVALPTIANGVGV